MSTRFAAILSSAFLVGCSIGATESPNPASQTTIQKVSKQKGEKTPEQVYEEFCQSIAKGDSNMFFACVTPKYGEWRVFETAFAFGMRDEDSLKRHLNEASIEKALKEAEGKVSDDKRREIFVAAIKDKQAFFNDVATRFGKDIEEDSTEPLRNVKIIGDRARGVVTKYIIGIESVGGGPDHETRQAYDSPIHFARTKSGWRIDHPTPEEAKQDARESDEQWSSKSNFKLKPTPPAD